MKEITRHQVNQLNEAVRIIATDEPDEGGAHHTYLLQYGPEGNCLTIDFQNGPIKEVGVNGVSNEALLAIVADRLEGFQFGPFACAENKLALDLLQDAMTALASRTRNRLARGVEGTRQV